LPGSLWTISPGRAALLAEGEAIGLTYRPRLWALLPYEALASAIWALPALAIGLAMLRLPHWQPSHIAGAIIAAMVLSVLMGAVQLGGGNTSPAYLYDITNSGSTVGFFANSNHLATLLVTSLPFIAALAAHTRRHGDHEQATLAQVTALGLLLIALTGIVVNGSLAGFALAGPVAIGSVLIAVPASRLRRTSLVVLFVALAIGVAWLTGSQAGQDFLASEDIRSAGEGGRGNIWAKTWRAVEDFWPWGAGLGAFAEVFRRYEDPAGVANFFINHAHNDYLELLLEFGVLLVPLLAAFLIWWGRRAERVWQEHASDRFARAGALASAAILLHEIVDYPLRTAAMSSVFVACLCLMALPNRRRQSTPDAAPA
jgi:O-antigen ligase